MAPMI